MPTQPCLTPLCPRFATYRGRCEVCNRSNERNINRAGKRTYNTKRWENVRRRVLFLNPLCKCGEISTDVHHLVDLEDGGAPWALSNLEALCHSCHSRITRANQQRATS